jgi:hypothetical protein
MKQTSAPYGLLETTVRETLCAGNEVLLVLAIRLPCFSVTHERANNTHFGDNNYRENIGAYMVDYSQPDIVQWIKKQTAVELDKSRSFSLVIDTINYRATTPTGRPIEDGWLFFGLNDHPDSAVLGDRDLILRFRYKVAASEVIPKSEPNGMTPGNRFILVFSVD